MIGRVATTHALALPRRRFLVGSLGVLAPLAPSPASATSAQVAALIQRLVGDAPLHEGRVKLDLPVMVENGNAVSMTVSVDAPVGGVRDLHVFAPGTFEYHERSTALWQYRQSIPSWSTCVE